MSVVTAATPTHGLTSGAVARTGTPIDKHTVAIDVERMSFFYGEKQALLDVTAQLRAKSSSVVAGEDVRHQTAGLTPRT